MRTAERLHILAVTRADSRFICDGGGTLGRLGSSDFPRSLFDLTPQTIKIDIKILMYKSSQV